MSEEKNTEEKKGESRYFRIIGGDSDEMRDISYWDRPFLHRMRQKLKSFGDLIRRKKKFWVLGAVALCIVVYLIYNNIRVFENYTILKSSERSDVSATNFVEMDGNLLKYSPDGVVYMKGDSVLWSSTYSIQSPVVDVCETIAVVGDQNGSQIYIYDSEIGQIGSFQTLLPIKKVKVASQGVVAVVLEDGEVTWINLYDTEGNEIAKHRTTVAESGYPVDIAISPDGLKLAVSFLRTTNGVMNTRVVFYNFGAVGKAQTNNEVGSEVYENTLIPKMVYLDNNCVVAFRDNGFTLFKGKQIPEKTKEVELDQDIVSIFYDESALGFVFQSDLSEHKYKIQIYNLSGKMTMEEYIDEEFQNIKLSSGKIIVYGTQTFSIYSTHGKKIFEGKYQEEIVDLMKISGFRKYLIITKGSMDQIRLK